MTEQHSEFIHTPAREPESSGMLGRWYVQGARSTLLRSPRWDKLTATPAVIAALITANVLLALLLERLYIVGPADFYWQAIAGGWFSIAVTAWICYLMRPQPLPEPVAGAAPSAAHLFCMVLAQLQVITLATGLLFVALIRSGADTGQAPGPWRVWTIWALWLLPLLWIVLAQLTLLWRSGTRRPGAMLAATLALLASTAMYYAVRPANFWYPAEQADAQVQRERLSLTQDVMEAQPQLLAERLMDIQPQRPGTVDLYALSFAPYADEDVFRRESGMVAEVMARRFDAGGRVLQLVNHVQTVEQWPWATPKNLQRALRHIAALMDPEEDVLFLHLTSHGARNGELAADFWPMSVDTVKPADLKAWLDEAGVRYRVISISACYSGSWIAPLADENTLIMTAADAEHTSYGCGRGSELTYFGRAMYDEQLRTNTLSFEEAHATAREIIRKREEEAGKDDGYSNPQIEVGAEIRDRLVRLREGLIGDGKR